MRKEFEVLEVLNEDIDQLASTAKDCGTLCPEAETLLSLAWWFTEVAYREVSGHCSNHSRTGHCMCCNHFKKLTPLAQSIKARIR